MRQNVQCESGTLQVQDTHFSFFELYLTSTHTHYITSSEHLTDSCQNGYALFFILMLLYGKKK